MSRKRFKWTLELEVDETWVADGFDLDNDRALMMLAQYFPYAYGSELGAKVIKAPDPDEIARAQGYESARDKSNKERQ